MEENTDEHQEFDLSQLPEQQHDWRRVGNVFYCTIHDHGAFGVVNQNTKQYTSSRDVPPRQGSRPTQINNSKER